MQKPVIKASHDKLRKMMRICCIENRYREGSSGYIEIVSEVYRLLDDLISEKDEEEEEKKKPKNDLQEQEDALVRVEDKMGEMTCTSQASSSRVN